MKGADILSFTNDNIPFISANNMTKLVTNLERSTHFILKWFTDNQMHGNATKCDILFSTKEKIVTKVDSAEMKTTNLKNYEETLYTVN